MNNDSLVEEAEAIVEEVIRKARSMGQKISLQLIIDRNLPLKQRPSENKQQQATTSNNYNSKKSDNTRSISSRMTVSSSMSDEDNATTQALLKLTHIRLDRENIDEIDNLAEFLNHKRLTHLYLHQNRIRRIENLDFLVALTYLNLSHNCIERVQNLRHLERLQLLDLSSNKIDGRVEDILVELPPNLAFLDLRDNPIFATTSSSDQTLFDLFLDKCPNLSQINGVNLSGDHVDDDNDEDEENKMSKGDSENEVATAAVTSFKDSIVERSRMRHRNDRISLEHEWEQKKVKLESIKASMNEKFKFNIVSKSNKK